MPAAILAIGAEAGKRGGTPGRGGLFGWQEALMLKALLTPIVLGLAVAMVIRLMVPRRAY